MRDDPELCAAVIHALNRWMAEEWPFTFQGRIFSTPVITPGLVDRAIEEFEWVHEHGAKAILMRPAPAWGFRGPRSFALKEHDPFWRRVEEAGTLIIIHASDTGYARYQNEWEGVQGETLAFAEPKPFSEVLHNDFRDIQDALTSVIAHGLVARFPRLRFAAIENGAGWVPGLLRRLDYTYRRMPQAFAEPPSATFKRNFWIHPFHEEDPRELVRLLGADHVIFGSDFPHVEGLADPVSYVKELDGLPQEDVRKIMGANMMGLLGIAS